MSSLPSRKTECSCKGPGYCSRHHIRKTEAWFHLCCQDPEYFQAWEIGRGPGQLLPRGDARAAKPKGPGTILRRMLGSCGQYQFVPEMDRLGTDGCRSDLGRLVGVVLQDKDKFAMRLNEDVVRRMILLAINESEELQVEAAEHGGDIGAGASAGGTGAGKRKETCRVCKVPGLHGGPALQVSGSGMSSNFQGPVM